MRHCFAIFLLALSCLARGEMPADLPKASQVLAALRMHPQVRAAVAAARAAEAQQSGLVAGPHESTLRVSSHNRRDRSVDQRYREYEIGVERAFRLPGKVALDAELGEATVASARHVVGEALHATSRELLSRWFAWQREAVAVAEWKAQVELQRALLVAVNKKVGAGETARLEAKLVEAQLAQAEAQLAQALMRRERAASEWRQHFPSIALPEKPLMAEPLPVVDTADVRTRWEKRILDENHELAVAQSETRRARLAAARSDAERLPDPTLGLSLGSERDGQERIVGVHVSIPLPGRIRTANARIAAAEADAAAMREAMTLARAESEARQTVAAAITGFFHWQRLEEVARRMEENAALLEKAWRLGEGQYTDLQMARRQSLEARMAASQARLDANEARYRMLLDAHELWALEPEMFLDDTDKPGLSGP